MVSGAAPALVALGISSSIRGSAIRVGAPASASVVSHASGSLGGRGDGAAGAGESPAGVSAENAASGSGCGGGTGTASGCAGVASGCAAGTSSTGGIVRVSSASSGVGAEGGGGGGGGGGTGVDGGNWSGPLVIESPSSQMEYGDVEGGTRVMSPAVVPVEFFINSTYPG